jgi:hypothetical protein
MRLECMMVCVNYNDKLAITLPLNKKHFDNVVVITISTDKETVDICKRNNVTCIVSNRMKINNSVFNKAAMLNDGLKHLKRTDWILVTDADIILPQIFRSVLTNLDINNIYWTDRYLCKTRYDLEMFSKRSSIVRLWEHDDRPAGFFNLFNFKAQTIKNYKQLYDERFKACNRYDTQFFRSWPKNNRKKFSLPVIHLGHIGIDWYGRISEKFL